MGFRRRITRKVTPRKVRRALRPARTIKNRVTPRAAKRAKGAAYTVAHPVGAAENAAMGNALNRGKKR